MLAGVARRVFFMVLVLAVATFGSFVFFWTHDLPLKGKSSLHGYEHWLHGLVTGGSYRGMFGAQPLWPEFRTALVHTAVLLGGAALLVVPLCVAFAALAAWRRDGVLDVLVRSLAYAAWGLPPFLLALVVVLASGSFGNHAAIGPFPVGGWPGQCRLGTGIPCPYEPGGLHHVWHVLLTMVFPALALAAGFVGVHSRHLRASLLQTLEAPFVVTARGKGLSETRIVFRHAMRLSVVTFVGSLFSDVGAIFGAALAVDVVFQVNGLGTVLISLFPINSYSPIDVNAVQLLLLITGAFILLSGVVADGVLAWLDPRLRRDG